MKSLVCENSPAVLTDLAYHEALLNDTGPWAAAVRRRKQMLPAIYDELPTVKKLHEVEGSVYWMLSHPSEAADVVCEWFHQTMLSDLVRS